MKKILSIVALMVSVGCSGLHGLVTLKTPSEVYNFIFDVDNFFAQQLNLDLWVKYTDTEVNKINTEARKKYLGIMKSDTNAQLMEALNLFKKENANFVNAVKILYDRFFKSGKPLSTHEIATANQIIRNLKTAKVALSNYRQRGVLEEIKIAKRDARAGLAQVLQELILYLQFGIEKSIQDFTSRVVDLQQ